MASLLQYEMNKVNPRGFWAVQIGYGGRSQDSGKGSKDYTKKLAEKVGLDDPADNELRHCDRTCPEKIISNDDWENPHDPHATITRMKDGTTRAAYKVEHAVDLDTDIVASTRVYTGSVRDTAMISTLH